MLKSINLSVAVACGADCIYCPSNRGERMKPKLMPLDTMKRIVDEVSSEAFRKEHDVTRIIVGENGDAFLNKDLIEMLRYIRSMLPEVRVALYTNFQHFTEEKAESIIKEELVDSIRCNIDGFSKENYFNAKRLDLDNTRKNLRGLIKIRGGEKKPIPIHISVLTLNNYIHTIHNNLGFYPVKLKDLKLAEVEDDFLRVKDEYEMIIDKNLDSVYGTVAIGAWAEREKIDTDKIDYRRYRCPILNRVKEEVFIAPDGTWYACCLDSDTQLPLGNINEASLDEIFRSERRRRFIGSLENQRFKEIGGPCATVNCCQTFHKNKLISKVYGLLQKNESIMKLIYRYYGE